MVYGNFDAGQARPITRVPGNFSTNPVTTNETVENIGLGKAVISSDGFVRTTSTPEQRVGASTEAAYAQVAALGSPEQVERDQDLDEFFSAYINPAYAGGSARYNAAVAFDVMDRFLG